MDEKDFQDLLNEIDSMSVEEYNNFHEKALKMKCQIQNLMEGQK